MHLLLIEDDLKIASFVTRGFREAGFNVEHATDGNAGLQMALSASFDVAVVDIMLPGRDGLSVIDELRRRGNRLPVIILSARGEERDKLRGFEAGVDDYIIKPFSSAVLVARINAVLRRYDKARLEDVFLPVYRHEDLVIDVESFRVTIGGEEVILSSTEFKLLTKFAESKGEVLSSEELLSSVWGPDFRDDKTILWVALSRLKQKIEEDPKKPKYIQTIKGVGYLMPEEE